MPKIIEIQTGESAVPIGHGFTDTVAKFIFEDGEAVCCAASSFPDTLTMIRDATKEGHFVNKVLVGSRGEGTDKEIWPASVTEWKSVYIDNNKA